MSSIQSSLLSKPLPLSEAIPGSNTRTRVSTPDPEKVAKDFEGVFATMMLKDMRQTLLTATPERVAEVLLPRLLERIAGHLVPLRPGRHYPRPKDSYTRKRKRTKPKQRKNLGKAAQTAAQKT